jgi:hypothetical protein
MVAVITIRCRAGPRDGFQKVGAAPRGTMPTPAGTSTSDSSTRKASARSSTYHASSSRFRSPDYPKPDSRNDHLYRTAYGMTSMPRDRLRAADAARGGPEGKGRSRVACATASSRPPSAPASPSRTRSASRAGPAVLAARRPRRAGAPAALARAATGARGAGLTPTLAGDAGVSSTPLGKRQPTAGRAAGRPRAGSSSRGGSSLGLGRPDRRS